MRIHRFLFAVLLLAATVSCSNADEDIFLYGVQIFSRPFDWTSPYDTQAQKAGQARFTELLHYALSLDVDIIRGGTTYDNMSDHAAENNHSGSFRGMNFLLPLLRNNSLILDWVITGTSQSSLDSLNTLMTLAGEHVSSSGANVIYEIWNEPDLKKRTFWSGTADDYYNSLIPEASQAIKTADPSAQIMNGGLVLDPNDSDKSFLQPAIDALRAGKISMLAMHSHNNLADFCSLWKTEISANMGADASKVLLNESGTSMNHNYSSRTKAAMNLAGKLLKAKSFGAGGFIAFHLGGLKPAEQNDEEKSYSLIDLQDDGSLVPNTSYYTLKTAIKYTKGLKYSGRVIADDGYTLLFEDDNGRKTLAGIGRRPSQSEIYAAFGAKGYAFEYNLSGDRIPNGTAIDSDNIVYLVSGFDMPEFRTHSLLLSGQIGVNFYMDLPEISGADYADSYMDFDIAGDTSNPPQYFDSEFMNRGKTYYGFRCYIKSVQMADKITAVFHYGDDNTVTHEYSAEKYLDDSLAADISATERALIEAIKDFGHYAQLYLSRINGWELGTAHKAIDCENEYSDSDIEAARQAVNDNAIVKDIPADSGIKRVGFSLNLDADTTINLYIYPEDDYTGSIAAYISGSTANDAIYQPDRKRYKVEISNIPAHRLAETFTVRVVGKKEFDVKVSAFSYAYAALNDSNASSDEIDTAVSLYRYYTTNMDYRSANGL